MKIIITESQEKKISVTRRFMSDYDLIWDIVDEALGVFINQFNDFDNYLEYISRSSAITYLYHYFDNENEEGYLELEGYITKFIKKEFELKIIEFWLDNK
jgi:hypothetical protein